MHKAMTRDIEKSFRISTADMRAIIRNFRAEMERGLAGEKSSLKMIPSYARRPSGDEKGSFIALDLGGTNFRILGLKLKGSGRSGRPKAMKFVLGKSLIAGTGKKMFDFLAASLKTFLKKNRVSSKVPIGLGFTFSFPVKQAGIASGSLVCWTKGFRASGVVGKDVVGLLKEALARKGLTNIIVSALANDTVGTLVARSYEDPNCDIGVIIGTGTNACYPEKVTNIAASKLHIRHCEEARSADEAISFGLLRRFAPRNGSEMIINIEWGNFNKLAQNRYDRRLDRASDNPGKQILEKMVSGMYLGEVTRLVLVDMAGKGALRGIDPSALRQAQGHPEQCRGTAGSGSSRAVRPAHGASDGAEQGRGTSEARRGIDPRHIATPYSFRTEEMSDLAAVSTDPVIRDVLDMVSSRAARIAAACMAAIIKKMDPVLSKKHTIAIDGSVYEKYPDFSGNVRKALKEIFGKKARRIKTALAKDGSGKGAAIIAAVA